MDDYFKSSSLAKHEIPKEDIPVFYHYTTEEGKKGIDKSGTINPSEANQTSLSTNLILGPGIYVTTLDPSHSKKEIIENNYGEGNVEGNEDKADCFIKITPEQTRQLIDNGAVVSGSDTRPNVFVIQSPSDQAKEKDLIEKGYDFDN